MTKRSLLAVAVALSLGVSGAMAQSVPLGERLSPQQIQLANAHAAFVRFLSSWENQNTDSRNVASIFAEGAVIELSLARPEWTVNIEGREAIAEYIGDLGRIGSQWTFKNVHFFPTQHKGVVFAQFDATNTSEGADQPLAHHDVVAIEMNGEKIERIRDFGATHLLAYLPQYVGANAANSAGTGSEKNFR